MSERSRKVVVVGDGMVGKTALLTSFVKDDFEGNYIPTVFETTAKVIQLNDGRQVTLSLWDTGGQEEFDQIRQLAYPGADLILLCYAVDCPTSLENIMETWIHEVKYYCPHIPLILVGCKVDKRVVNLGCQSNFLNGNPNGRYPLIDVKIAHKIGEQIGAHVVIECSALTKSNVYSTFELAARFILDSERQNQKNFNLLSLLHITSSNINQHNNHTNNYTNHNSANHNNFENRYANSLGNKRQTNESSIKRRSSQLKRRLTSSDYICFMKRNNM